MGITSEVRGPLRYGDRCNKQAAALDDAPGQKWTERRHWPRGDENQEALGPRSSRDMCLKVGVAAGVRLGALLPSPGCGPLGASSGRR